MRRLWRFADERGFTGFTVSDHFQETPHQTGDLDCFEAIASLTAAALETERVRVGCLVFCVAYRHPALLAKSLSVIDQLSGGRVDCGLGAGWHELEFRAYGIPFPAIKTREDQLEEYVQVLRLLFDEKAASFAGVHYQLDHGHNNPKPVQARLPIWIGGAGEKRTLRTAARFADGWNAPYLAPEAWRAKSAVLDSWCEDFARDPQEVTRSVNVGFYLGADARGQVRQEETFRRHWGTSERLEQTGHLRGGIAEARDLIGAYRDAGVARLNIALRQGPYDWDALAAFAELVMPAFA